LWDGGDYRSRPLPGEPLTDPGQDCRDDDGGARTRWVRKEAHDRHTQRPRRARREPPRRAGRRGTARARARHHRVPPAPDVLHPGGSAAVGVRASSPDDARRRGPRARRLHPPGRRGALRLWLGRGFRAGVPVGPRDRPAEVSRRGGPLSTQPMLRFRLSVEGSTPMDVTITDRPDLVLVGHAAQVPLIHQGVNPHIQEHVASIPPEEHTRLKALSDTEPSGILAVTAGLEPDAPEGAMLTYLH